MARMPRVVVSGYPHHVTQRGNRRQKTFFCEEDYLYYLDLMSEYTRQSNTEVWAYCLMPNHIHLVMVPSYENGLRASLGEAHRRYTRYVNFKKAWRGHLWQELFQWMKNICWQQCAMLNKPCKSKNVCPSSRLEMVERISTYIR